MSGPDPRLQLRLRDGTPAVLRRLRPDDRALVAEAYKRLSPEARYQRMWTNTGELLGDHMLDRLLDQDATRHMTWVVLDPARPFPAVGGASWWRSATRPDEAEISAMILDGDQRRGIGTLLLAVMWLTALRAGIAELAGYTLADNRSAAAWMRDCGADGSWDGYKLEFRWHLHSLDSLPATRAAAELAEWLASLAPALLANEAPKGGEIPGPQ